MQLFWPLPYSPGESLSIQGARERENGGNKVIWFCVRDMLANTTLIWVESSAVCLEGGAQTIVKKDDTLYFNCCQVSFGCRKKIHFAIKLTLHTY